MCFMEYHLSLNYSCIIETDFNWSPPHSQPSSPLRGPWIPRANPSPDILSIFYLHLPTFFLSQQSVNHRYQALSAGFLPKYRTSVPGHGSRLTYRPVPKTRAGVTARAGACAARALKCILQRQMVRVVHTVEADEKMERERGRERD